MQFAIYEYFTKRQRYCVAVVVWNEGERIRNQLLRLLPFAGAVDIVIADGRSTDGSLDEAFLNSVGVRTLLVTDERGLCTATRMAIHYAMDQGYEAIITMDGNGKDGVEALPAFIAALDEGYDLVQGSRFIKGGVHRNTPLERYVGIRYVVAPLLAISGFRYTDPTNAFRGLSMKFLKDKRVQPLRPIFVRFNLQHYFLFRAAKLKFNIKEIPVSRVYPDDGSVPTKIVSWRTKLLFLKELIFTVFGRYDA